MATLWKHPKSGYWYVLVRVMGKSIQRSTKTKNREKAELVRRKWENLKLESEFALYEEITGKKKKTRFGEFLNEFTAWAKVNYAEETYKRSVRYRLPKFLAFFGSETFLGNITYEDIERYKQARRKAGIKKSTINRELNILQAIFREAEKCQVIRKRPQVSKFQETPYDRKAIHYLEKAEVKDLFDAAKEQRKWKGHPFPTVYAYSMLALYTGMRPKEIYNLRWDDIDLESGKLYVKNTKSYQDRVIDIHEKKLKPFLEELRQGLDVDSPYVLGGEHTNLRKSFDRVKEQAGLPKITMYSLRHTYGTHLALKGEPIHNIMAVMGHSRIETTLRYLHAADEYRRQTVNSIDY